LLASFPPYVPQDGELIDEAGQVWEDQAPPALAS